MIGLGRKPKHVAVMIFELSFKHIDILCRKGCVGQSSYIQSLNTEKTTGLPYLKIGNLHFYTCRLIYHIGIFKHVSSQFYVRYVKGNVKCKFN
jgi:hypothetical protein